MPELPEVETIVRYLQKRIRGKRIISFISTAGAERLFRDHKNFSEIKNAVVGKKIKAVERVGKNIIFKLSNNSCLVLHLMMTGKILLNPAGTRPHDRFLLKLSGGTKLIFNDIRKFGRCRVIPSAANLGGPDALTIGFKVFAPLLKKRKVPVKNLLMNQALINGIGNIYADEILWQASVHPARRGNSLTVQEVKNIFQAIKTVLRRAIKKGGTSSRDYRKPDGKKGGYYQVRQVYQRTGQRCTRDGAKIQRIKIAGRSTHFCPKHQKKKPVKGISSMRK